jgi:acyl dehydratase
MPQTGAAALRYLDDLQAGDRFVSGEHPLDEAQITSFARQFDPQPFHLDHEAAKATLFGGLAASGWHTAAITMRLLVGDGLPLAGGIREPVHGLNGAALGCNRDEWADQERCMG